MLSDESTEESCYLYVKGQKIPLNIVEPTLGKPGIDIQPLLGNYGIMTFDPAFKSTASCYSKITYLNGDAGELFHRGYPIEQLAAKCTYLEVCQLLWEGELPSAEKSASFEREIKNHTMVHEQLRHFFNGFPLTSHPMSMMCGVIGSLSAFYHDALDIQNEEHRRLSAIRLIAKMPTIAAMTYKYSIGQPFMYPRNELSYVANFLYMMFGTPTELYTPDPLECEALESIFILHADHEQNASTSTVRIAGSSGADPFACISAGIASLWGPMHGGANQAVIEMLEEIGSPDRIPLFLEKAKDKNDPFRLMGFGHRVYKNFDPRARVIKDLYTRLLASKNITHDPLFEIAKILEQTALSDSYFIDRKLYPNVDFYSGLILKMLKIPTSMFTVIFAMARTIGWISQWNEMISDKKVAIARPQQIYVGPTQRDIPEEFRSVRTRSSCI